MIDYDKLIQNLDIGKISLLGEILISNEEEQEIINFTQKLVQYFLNGKTGKISEKDKLKLVLALVQIAKKEYNDRNFWYNLGLTINIPDIPTSVQSIIGQIFLETIRHYNLFEIPKDPNQKNMYVQNILAHSYVANEYLDGYFEFLFSFYEKNLLCEIDEKTLGADIKNFRKYISKDYEEKISNNCVKSYKLLKSTRSVLQYGDDAVVNEILKKHLICLDKIFYSNEIQITDNNNYFIQKLKQWTIDKAEEIETNRKKYWINAEIFKNRAPALCMKDGRPYIVIPPLKLPIETLDCNVEIFINNELKKNCKLNIDYAFNAKYTELTRIDIEENWIFENIQIFINGKETKIPNNPYRFFKESKYENFDYYQINSLIKDKNIIIISNNVDTSLSDHVYQNSLWKEYEIWVDENTKFIVSNNLISANNDLNEKGIEIYFKSPDNFIVYDKLEDNTCGKRIEATFEHPIIFLRVESDFLNRNPIVECNGIRKKLKECEFMFFSKDNGKIDIQINLFNIFHLKEFGEYKIQIIDAGKEILRLKYLLLDKIDFIFDKNIYFKEKEAIISYTGNYYIHSLSKNCKRNGKGKYYYNLSKDENIINFEFGIDEKEYIIELQINIFKYKFSMHADWNYLFEKKDKYISYEDIRFHNYLFVSLPNIDKAELFFGQNTYYPILGEYDKNKNFFSFDISKIHNKFKSNDSYNDTLNIYYKYNKSEVKKEILHITNHPIINKFELNYDEEKEMGYINAEFEGCPEKYEIWATLIDNNQKCSTNPIKVNIVNGKNYIPGINSENKNSFFKIIQKLTEKMTNKENIFSKNIRNVQAKERILPEKIYNVSPLNIFPIYPKSQLKIESIIYKNEKYSLYYDHQIAIGNIDFNNKKMYYGKLFTNGLGIAPYKVNVCSIKNNPNSIFVSLSNNTNLWYNFRCKYLVDKEPYNKEHYIYLDSLNTKFIVSQKESRRKDFAIQTSREL